MEYDNVDDVDELVYENYSFYEFLELPIRSAPDTVRESFRWKIMNSDGINKVADLTRAYFVLSHPELKRKYDETGQYRLERTFWTPQRLAEEGQLGRLDQVLKANPAFLNELDERSHSCIYVAARANRKEVVEYLMERGADPDLKQRDGSTALHAACYYGHKQIMHLLLEYGADPTIVNNFRSIPFQEIHADFRRSMVEGVRSHLNGAWNFATTGQLSKLKELIEREEIPNNSRNSLQRTVLHCAANKGKCDVMEWLINVKEAPIDEKDKLGRTPLHLAARGGHAQAVQMLLDHCADPFIKDNFGHTALESSSSDACKTVFELQKVKDPFKMVTDKRTGSWWFKHWFQPFEIDKRDDEGRTLLYIAAKEGECEIVEQLIAKRATLDLAQCTGSTPLHAAAWYGHPNVVASLLASRANPILRNGLGRTPMDEAMDVEDPTIKQQITAHFRAFSGFSDHTIVFTINCFDRKSPTQKSTQVLVSQRTTFVEVLKVLDPSYIPSTPTGRHIASFNLPYRFYYGGRSIQCMSSFPVLQEIAKARYSMSSFIYFPLALEYEKIDISIAPTDVRNNLPPLLFEKDLPVKQEVVIEKELKVRNCSIRFTSEGKPKIQLLEVNEGSVPNCLIVINLADSGEGALHNSAEVMIKSSLISTLELFLYNHDSHCWYGLPPPTTRNGYLLFPLPEPAIYSITFKEIINKDPLVQISRDLLKEGSYMSITPVYGTRFVKIRLNLKLPENFNDAAYETVYHGSPIDRLESIVTNGLLVPASRNNYGKTVDTKQQTADPEKTHDGIKNWGFAIFVSPLELYARLPIYADKFQHHIGDEATSARATFNGNHCQLVYECKVSKEAIRMNKVTKHANTTPLKPGYFTEEELKTSEWRILDSSVIFISAITLWVITPTKQ